MGGRYEQTLHGTFNAAGLISGFVRETPGPTYIPLRRRVFSRTSDHEGSMACCRDCQAGGRRWRRQQTGRRQLSALAVTATSISRIVVRSLALVAAGGQ